MVNPRLIGFAQLASTNVVGKICWALTLVLLLRHLGAASFGVLATLWSMSIVAGGFVDLGTGQALVRDGARAPRRARAMARQSLRVQYALSVAVAALLSVCAWYAVPYEAGAPERLMIVSLGILTPLIDRFQNLFTVFSQLGGNYTAYSGWRSLYFLVVLVALAITTTRGAGLLSVSCVYFIITLMFAVLAGRGTWRLMPPEGAADPAPSRELIRAGLPFLGVAVLTLAYGRIEVSVLGAWGETAAAGAYHIVYQLILVVYSISGIYFTVMYPRLYTHLDDRAAMLADFRETTRWLSLLAWLATPPLLLFPADILRVLGGEQLVQYAPMLHALAFMIFLAPASAALNFLLPMDRMRARVACDGLGIALTSAGAMLAAAFGVPVVAAAMAVFGYAAAIASAHAFLAGMLPGITAAALREFLSAGARALVAVSVAAFLPVPWWIGCVIYASVFALLLIFTAHPAGSRVRHWFALRH